MGQNMILDEIAGKTRERIEAQKKKIPLEAVRREALAMPADTGFPFEKALRGESSQRREADGRTPRRPEIGFICEVKKASPSKGIIAQDFPYLQIAAEYERAGAAALSVLTEPFYFKGSDAYLKEIAGSVSIPVLRKDFTVDEYMIYEAKTLGASAVLLICAILTEETLKDYLALARSLGLSALVEAHDEDEVRMALRCGAGIVGVNNRDLKTFQVDITTSLRLRSLVPENVLYVSESGIRTPEDIEALRANGTNAALVGETLMKSADKKAALERLKGKRDA